MAAPQRSDEAIVRAAAALGAATHVLIGAGAGMSADSGLATYASFGEGYHDLCQPTALLQTPAEAFGFWVRSLRSYRAAAPHAGYTFLETLCASKPRGHTCVYTSNVDGLFRRFATLAERLHEIHGCLEEWMCSSSMGFSLSEPALQPRSRGGIFEAHNAAVLRQAAATDTQPGTPWRTACAALRVVPTQGGVLAAWDAHCTDESRNACATAAEGEAPAMNTEAPAAQPPTAEPARPSGSDAGASAAVAWGASVCPCCPLCASPLRPCVVMFNDTDPVLLGAKAKAASAYQAWEEQMEAAVAAAPSNLLIVVEIGCGERVPSVRRECEDVVRDTLRRGGRALLVRINPEGASNGQARTSTGAAAAAAEEEEEEEEEEALGPDHLVTIRDGALSALTRIEAQLNGGGLAIQ
jgi:NAD-dependent SIR2 family protein deacetylase